MKTLTKKSTYNLVVASEDRRGAAMEAAIYALIIVSTILSVLQFATQGTQPSVVLNNNSRAAIVAKS